MAELGLLLGAVLAAGLLVLGLAALRQRPQRGLLLLAALTPFNGLLVLVPGGASFAYWKEALLLLTLAATLLAPLRSLRGGEGAGPAPSLPWWPAVAALVVFGSVSALVTAGLVGLYAIKITFFYLLIPLVLWRAPFSVRDRDSLVTILMSVGVLNALVGLWQQWVGDAFLVRLGYSYGEQVRTAGGLLRSFGTFEAPFPFGLYIMATLLVGGAVALAEPRRVRNALFLYATPLMLAGIGLSIVRASYLGLAVGLLWLAVHRYRPLFGVLIGIGGASLLALLFGSSKVLAPLFSSTSLEQRGSGWSDIVSDLLSHPLGLGLGASGSAADRIAEAAGRTASANYQPDNYYVKMALELGPVGLWLFVLTLLGALISTLRAAQVLRGRDGALAMGVSAAVLAAAAASLVSTYFEIFPLDVWFWLLLGVVGCSVAQRTRGSTSTEPGSVAPPVSAGVHSPFGQEEVASRPTPASS